MGKEERCGMVGCMGLSVRESLGDLGDMFEFSIFDFQAKSTIFGRPDRERIENSFV